MIKNTKYGLVEIKKSKYINYGLYIPLQLTPINKRDSKLAIEITKIMIKKYGFHYNYNLIKMRNLFKHNCENMKDEILSYGYDESYVFQVKNMLRLGENFYNKKGTHLNLRKIDYFSLYPDCLEKHLYYDKENALYYIKFDIDIVGFQKWYIHPNYYNKEMIEYIEDFLYDYGEDNISGVECHIMLYTAPQYGFPQPYMRFKFKS